MPSKRSTDTLPKRKRKPDELPTPGPFSEHQLWTRDDFRILHLHYPSKGAAWVARKLGRTKDAVKIKASRIGLKTDGMRPWTEKELRYLCRNNHRKELGDIAEALGRTVASVRGQARVMRAKAKSDPDYPYRLQAKPVPPLWTDKEIRLLRQKYGTVPTVELAKRLGRNPSAIGSKASKLGITFPHAVETDRKRARGFRTAPTIEQMLTARQKKFILQNMTRLGCAEIARRLDLPHGRVLRYAKLNGYDNSVSPRRWKPEELEFLAANHGKMLMKDMAARLGRKPEAVVAMAKQTGLPAGQGLYAASRRWSADDEEMLRKLYPTVTLREIAERLGRPLKSVIKKSRHMKLHLTQQSKYRADHVWTPEQDARLRKLYGTMPYRELAGRLGRTPDAISRRAIRLGLAEKKGSPATPSRAWTPEEDEVLRKGYRRLFARDLAGQLGRSAGSVIGRARFLGITRERRRDLPNRPWTEKEDRAMRKGYGKRPVEELAESLGRTPGAVQSRARTLGLRQPPKPRAGEHRHWTPEEEKLLRKEYGRIPAKELAARLGRTVKSVHLRAIKSGLSESKPRTNPMKRWTKGEDEELRKGFGRLPLKELAARLDRTIDSINGRARMLGLAGKGRK